MNRPDLPNFLYIGPDKAGSTWLFHLFQWHPEIFVTPAKDLYFFDRYYDRGLDWYRNQFREAEGETKIAEICHDYLYSEQAARRIKRDLPDVQLMICLREPVERAFSSYLNMKRHGMVDGTFEEALESKHELIDHGRYHSHLQTYLEYFDQGRFHLAIFDDLKQDSEAFAHKLFRFLAVEEKPLPDELTKKQYASAQSRITMLSKIVKYGAVYARKMGLERIVGKIKTSPLVQKILYKPYNDEKKPEPAEETVSRLKDTFRDEISRLDETWETSLVKRWDYE